MTTARDIRHDPSLADHAASALREIVAERERRLEETGIDAPVYPSRIARALLAYQHAVEMHEIEGCRYARDPERRGQHLAAVLEKEWAAMIGAIADEIGQAETARWLATELPDVARAFRGSAR
jgi:hypothetical protein